MKRFYQWMLLALLGLFCGNAMACRMVGYVWPTSTELASTSQLVFIAHVEKVQPLSKSDEEFVRSGFASAPNGISVRVPTERAEFSLVRNLKGLTPKPALLESSVWNCSGVTLEQGSDYLIFANAPEKVGADIAPAKGSFKLDGSLHAQVELQNIENYFTLQAMKP